MPDPQSVIARTEAHVRATLEGEGSGHDWWHIHRVRRLALAIGQQAGADLLIVELAALLHDIADWKFNGGDLDAGPRAASAWLASLGVDATTIERVAAIVGGISFKGADAPLVPLSLDGQVVQDADRLDAIGAIGIARTFAYGGHTGTPLYDPADVPERHTSAEAYRASTATPITHFYEKLLLLKDRLNTDAARQIATERHAFMEAFLAQFFREWDGEDGAALGEDGPADQV